MRTVRAHIACLLTCRCLSCHSTPFVILSPLVYTKISCLASIMATKQDVEFNQMFLNMCVLLDGLCLTTSLIVTHYSSQGPTVLQSMGRRCINPIFCAVILLKNCPLDCPQTVLKPLNCMEEFQGNALRWKVCAYSWSLLLGSSIVLIFCLVIRANNVPSINIREMIPS